MNVETVSLDHITQLEQEIAYVLKTMRKAKIHDHPLYHSLHDLEQELGDERRRRFDEQNAEFAGY